MTLTLASSPQHYLVNLNVFCCFYSVFLFSLQKDGPYWTPIYVWPISTTFQKRCVRLIKTEASWPPPSTLSASHLLKTETKPKAGTETERETGTETETENIFSPPPEVKNIGYGQKHKNRGIKTAADLVPVDFPKRR